MIAGEGRTLPVLPRSRRAGAVGVATGVGGGVTIRPNSSSAPSAILRPRSREPKMERERGESHGGVFSPSLGPLYAS